MRLLIVLLVTSITCFGTTPKTNELIGEWIGVSIGKGSGLILDFKTNDNLVMGGIGTDSTVSLKYYYNKSSSKLKVEIKGKKENFGKIEKLTSDRLTILTDNSTSLEFVKIKDAKPGVRKTELHNLLKNNSWTLRQDSGFIRMDFLTTHRWDNESQPFEAMFHYWLSSPYKEKEIWNVGEYKGNLFLFFSNYQTDKNTQQVLEVSPDKIVTISYRYKESQVNVLERTKEKTQDIIDKLTTKKWNSIHLDTTFCGEWGQIGINDDDVKELHFLLKQMEFRFNSDKSYSALIDGKEWKSGQWKTTSDSLYIVLDDERDKMNWIEVRLENQNLVLAKLQQIKNGDRDYRLYMLTIRLE